MVIKMSESTNLFDFNIPVDKLKKACEKELSYISDKEHAMLKHALRDAPAWKGKITEKIPQKVRTGLESAFFKAFSTVLEKGSSLIGKTFNRDETEKDHQVRDYAVKLKGSRKELKQVRKSAGKSDAVNTVITTAEGAGLGALGIGLPDIVLFSSFILKGVYECASHYGRDFTDPRERYLILKMIEASLSRKDRWVQLNGEVDELMISEYLPTEEEMKEQIRHTANACAMDMLLQKFVQGLPIVGVLGGISNPVYYNRIMNYIKTKYHKAYILGLLRDM